MTLQTNDSCPQGIKEKLLEWEKCGWLTINHTCEDVEEQKSFTPKRQQQKVENPQEPKELIWCNQLKLIVNKIAEELNNKIIKTNARGLPRSYIFKLDSDGFCKMIDELYRIHKPYITDYLRKTKKPTGVTYIFPFLGEILKALIFNKKELQKTDIEPVIKTFNYNSKTALKKLSYHQKLYTNPDARLLVETAKTIGKKFATAE